MSTNLNYKVTYEFIINGKSYAGTRDYIYHWPSLGFSFGAAILAALHSAQNQGLKGEIWMDFYDFLSANNPSNSECLKKLKRSGIEFKSFLYENNTGGCIKFDLKDGQKHDDGKPQYHLLPPKALEAVAKVLTYGAKKYSPEGWRDVPNGQERYFDAAHRHLWAWKGGEELDPESGLSHLAHAAASLLFMMEH